MDNDKWPCGKSKNPEHTDESAVLNKNFLSGKRILPPAINKSNTITELIDNSMLAYNGGRLRAACQLLAKRYAAENVTVGMSLAGALTPAGLGPSAIIPLINHGIVDWIVATGANMYHDLHFAFDMPLHQGSHIVNDCELRKAGVIRIYDIYGDYYGVLMETDKKLRQMLCAPEFQKEMGTQEFYHHLGKQLNAYEAEHNLGEVSVLAAAYRKGVPVFTSSPGDSTIGMNTAGLELLSDQFKMRINPNIDVTESASIILNAKRSGGKTGVILVGGGSPKNFMLQTEPQIQEVLGLKEVGQDYFLQITDARPDTGGLSGATPSEAVSWGKVDPNQLEETIIVYADTTIVLPLMTAYVLQNTMPKASKRLYDKRVEMCEATRKEYLAHNIEEHKALEDLLGQK